MTQLDSFSPPPSTDAELIASLQQIFTGTLWTQAAQMQPYLLDWRKRKQGVALAVACPRSTEEVVALVRWCSRFNVAIVPQGGNTGLVGGATPEPAALATQAALVISLQKMNRILAIDAKNHTITVQAGCILQQVQDAAIQSNRLFALSLAAEGSCTVGGNLATNAGGVQVLRWGNAREQCLGLEVVTAQGEVWNGLKALRKDNTGYDLRDLFIGSEGTLGIITAAVLKLQAQPAGRALAWLACESSDLALQLLNLAQEKLSSELTAFELISEEAHGLVLRHFSTARRPLDTPSPWYVLLEVMTGRSEAFAAEQLESLLEAALKDGLISDGVIARTQAQAMALWALRENISEAQAAEGKNIKHDIALAVSQIPRFIESTQVLLQCAFPAVRLVTFGHMGDGNLHYNVSPAEAGDASDFLTHEAAINRIVYDNVACFNGSISAEHGLGTLRRDEAVRYKSGVELALMRAIKRALDPQGIMNPHKVLTLN